MQAGTVVAQIPDNAAHRRAVGQNDLGALEYFGPWKSPTLKHGQHSNLQFWQANSRSNLFHNRKWDCLQGLNLRKPYNLCGSVVSVGVLAAVFNRRSEPNRRSLPNRLSPCIRCSSFGRVSTPLRRSWLARLSKLDRLLSSPMDVPLIAIFYGYNSLMGCKPPIVGVSASIDCCRPIENGITKIPVICFGGKPSVGGKRKGSGDDRSLSRSQA